jgi:hypothetical protein
MFWRMAESQVIPMADNGEAGSEFLRETSWPGPLPVAVPAQPDQSEGTSTAVLEIGGAGERAPSAIVAAFRCGTSKFKGKE